MSTTLLPAQTFVRPPALQKGDTIAIIAPASCPLEERQHVNKCIAELEGRGYLVKVASNLMTRYGYLAGEDDKRAQAFMECWMDPSVKALWCYRGGYGSGRILPLLDYEAIRKNPKIVIGMSDATVLLNVLAQKGGMITFLGPNAGLTLMDPEQKDDAFSEQELHRVISAEALIPYRYPQDHAPTAPWTLRSGKSQGRIVGGNLTVIASLIGTPWQLECKGSILMLEDVKEEPYRIDRMLFQMQQANLLEGLAGVVLCSWNKCQGEDTIRSLTLEQVFSHYFGKAEYPVMMGFPSGHIPHQATLPIGCLAELDATEKSLTLLEPPVSNR